MSGRTSNTGKIVTACFFTFWCAIAFGMGFFLLEMTANSGPYGPPPIIAFMPFGMGILGLIICIAALRSKEPQIRAMPTYRPDTITYTGDYTIHPEFSEQKKSGKSIYQIPSVCPSCGAAISNEEVDWVGPLKAKCPYCNATIDAEERFL